MSGGMLCPLLVYKAAEETMESMYPDLFYKFYPAVFRVCSELDDPLGCPIPKRKTVRQITERVYNEFANSITELWGEKHARHEYFDGCNSGSFEIKQLVKTLIDIMVIDELLLRRREKYCFKL